MNHSETDLSIIVPLLQATYGTPERSDSRPAPVDELIMTILSQNTSDSNTERAFALLKENFPEWQSVIDAGTDEVIDAIRPGGLANQKGPRIQNVLGQVKEVTGGFDLSFLSNMEVDEALDWLTALPGVGPKTAACVVLFSLDMPAMPVDTHVYRVSLRLGIIPEGTSAERAHEIVGAGLSADETYAAHMLLIRHGRAICKARRPRCAECVLNSICPSAYLVST